MNGAEQPVDRTLLPPPEPAFRGEDWGTPVSPSYELPFRFTGTLKKVTVEAK